MIASGASNAVLSPETTTELVANAGAGPRPSLTLGDILRSVGAFGMRFMPTRSQMQVMRRVSECRTAAYGGHSEVCDGCGYERLSYNSCRDRHCPNCLGHKAREWLEARQSELLPTSYFHVVFTIPRQLSDLALRNKKVMYRILFAAAAETLREVAQRRLGAEVGFLAVLHTWSQILLHHPHIHIVIPGGGLSEDGKRWVSSRAKFFLPVRVLGRVFRAKFLSKLKEAFKEGQLQFGAEAQRLKQETAFAGWIGGLREKRWVVYAKPPFGSPLQVLKYLGRYTHKVAISNNRLVSFDGKEVTFRYRDRKLANVQRVMTLEAAELARRFLLHVLPKGMPRIRHYGFLANACRAKKLELCREALGVSGRATKAEAGSDAEVAACPTDLLADKVLCPVCRCGQMHRFPLTPPPYAVQWWTKRDTS